VETVIQRSVLAIAEVLRDMGLPRIQFTVRRLMVAVGICASILWVASITVEYWWTWTVIRAVKRGQSTRYSAEGFSRAGPRSVRALRDALSSDKKKTRLDALQSLGVIGRDPNVAVRDLARPAVPDLIDSLRDKDDDVRIWAAIALGQIGPNAVSAVEPLLTSIRDEEHPVVSGSAIQALGEIGPVATPALPVLASMVEDPQHRTHIMAIHAFWRIGPKGRAETSIVVPKLIDRLLTSKDPRERAWVAEILSEIGPAAREAIPALSTAVADPEQEVHYAANNALRALTGAGEKPESRVSTTTRNP
jgi:HEAT repeat protein